MQGIAFLYFCVSCIRYFLSPGLVHELISNSRVIMYNLKEDIAKVSKIFHKDYFIGIQYCVCLSTSEHCLGNIYQNIKDSMVLVDIMCRSSERFDPSLFCFHLDTFQFELFTHYSFPCGHDHFASGIASILILKVH